MGLRVCIIEDNMKAKNRLCECLTEYGVIRGIDFSFYSYNNALSFLDEYRCNFDLIFMDIELPDLDGMEATRRLRRVDKQVIVIFVTNMAQYAVKGYEVDALDFIVKPLNMSSFIMKMDRAIERFKLLQDAEIWINEGITKRKINVSSIKYVEVFGHVILYHTVSGDYKTYDQLKSIVETLSKYHFAMCNRCYLVNLRYVTSVDELSVTVGGEQLQMSHRKRRGFLDELNKYLGGVEK